MEKYNGRMLILKKENRITFCIKTKFTNKKTFIFVENDGFKLLWQRAINKSCSC